MDIERLKLLRDNINSLDKNEYYEIFKIVKRNSDNKYTENTNGIFINMNKLHDDTILELENFIEFAENNKKMLNNFESQNQN